MLARAPASSANLGPGFDAIAIALSLHVEVEVTASPSLHVEVTGEGAELAGDLASNLAARIACAVAGHDRLSIVVRSAIPLARGLGSSGAIALAAAAAAGAADPLAVAARADGHPENAAASMRGGLVAAAWIDDEVAVARLALDPAVRVVVVAPAVGLATSSARAVLDDPVAREDAVFNLQRMGLVVAGLGDLAELRPGAMADRLHEPSRAALFAPAAAITEALHAAGALGTCWSGAGPSVLAITTAPQSPQLADAGRVALAAQRIDGTVYELTPDLEGLQLS